MVAIADIENCRALREETEKCSTRRGRIEQYDTIIIYRRDRGNFRDNIRAIITARASAGLSA